MSFKQAVIQVGSYSFKAGLWEETFLPNHIVPSCVNIKKSDNTRIFGEREHDDETQEQIFPIVKGELVNFEEFISLLEYILKEKLALAAFIEEVALLLVIPHRWSTASRKKISKTLLETVGISGVYFGETPLMASFGCAASTCSVIDIGHDVSEISLVIEGEVVDSAQLMVGGRQYNNSISQEEVAFAFFETTGEEMGICDSLLTMTNACEAANRISLLENIVLTGGPTKDPKFSEALAQLLPNKLPKSEYMAEYQTKSFCIKTVPEYYPDIWKEATPLAAWFGAGICAKCILGDRKNLITKGDK